MKGSSRNPHPKARIRKSHLRPRRVSYLQKTRPDPRYDPYLMHEDCSEPLDVSIWMPMYWREFLATTQHLTCEEKGAYGQLIAHYWLRGGPLPDDDERLALMVGLTRRKWRKMRAVIAVFFQIKTGLWHHKNLEGLIAEARRQREKKSKAGKAGAEKRWQRHYDGNDSVDANALPSQCPSPVPLPSSPSLTGLVLQAQDALAGKQEHRLDDMTEQQIIDFCHDLFGEAFMKKHGGSWRIRLRENRSKVISVLRQVCADIREGHPIRHRGAYANDLWNRFAK
jgi:uncharacterized protein YdaU (DUF1376 family)